MALDSRRAETLDDLGYPVPTSVRNKLNADLAQLDFLAAPTLVVFRGPSGTVKTQPEHRARRPDREA